MKISCPNEQKKIGKIDGNKFIDQQCIYHLQINRTTVKPCEDFLAERTTLGHQATLRFEKIKNKIQDRITTYIRNLSGDFSEIWIRAKTSISQSLEHEKQATEAAVEKTIEQIIPDYAMKYRKVFEKTASERFPPSRPWDHAIDLKPDFLPTDCKVYPLSPAEQIELDKFIKENLMKEYIRPLNSPQASPFFFIAKKDAKALRP